MNEPDAGWEGREVRREKWPRIFTLEEANALLPLVKKTFDWIDERRAELEQISRALEVLELVATSGASDGSADHAQYLDAKAHFDSLVEEVQAELTRLTDMGVVLRDLDQGLVDFHALRNGRVVFLCWKRGEDDLTHWHTVESGFAGRRPLDG